MSGDAARSEQLFEQARSLIPGGVNSPVRAFTAVGGTPRFIERGAGPYIWDVDGNRYVDYVMSWGPLIHGHAFAPVVSAIESAAPYGTSYGAPTPDEVSLAKLVTECVPSIEMVRFVSSGTEAAMSALRLARGYTGRDLIVKFAGNYHGHADALLAQAGSGSLTLGLPTTPGVTRGATADTLVAPYNDTEALEEVFNRHGDQIAAVIVEPIAGNMGVVPPAPGFLQTIARLTRGAGSLFICDEVITGFRVALGGAQSLFDLDPDLTVLGKIIGGGLPVAAYGGKRSIMERMAPTGDIYQAGTLSGNPLAMRAGRANLEPLREPSFYPRLRSTTEALADELRALGSETGVATTVNGCTGMLTLFFTDGPVVSLKDAQQSNTEQFAAFFHAMLRRGIYLPPSQYEAWMLSAGHTEAIVERTLHAAREALTEIA